MKKSIRKLSIIYIAIIACALTSCASRVNVLTDTYSDMVTIPHGFHYRTTFAVIEPSAIDASKNSNVLLDKEVRYKIEKVLTSRGYRITHPEVADYVVRFFYGINFDTKTILSPLYIPGQTIKTDGNANVYGSNGIAHGNFTQTTTTSGTLDWIPQEVANNTRWLTIKVFKRNEIKKENIAPIWDGASISAGESGDIRDMINYLLASNLHFFGKSTHKQVNHTICADDETIQWLSEKN